MKGKDNNNNLIARQSVAEAKNNFKGYPLYPANEDIYSKSHEDSDIDPVDISTSEESTEDAEKLIIDETVESNSDLDVPGSELDDKQEEIGNEDEENNYYSIGDDDDDDLEEDKED